MRILTFFFLLFSLSASNLRAQSDESLDFLKAEIQKAAQQRDEARKRLLEVESDSADKVETLSSAQVDLQKRLDAASKNLLELEASAQMSKVAMERSEAEIAKKDQQIETLRQQQIETVKKYQETTRELKEELDQANLKGSESTESAAADLVAERNQLKEIILTRDRELKNLIDSQEKTQAQLDQFKELNSQLSTELKASQRSEALANAKLTALESRLSTLQQELANQYQERSELEQEKERLQGVIKDLQVRLDEAMNTRVPQSQMDDLNATLQNALSENQRLRDELASRENVPDLRKEFENIRKQRDLLQAKEKGLISKVDTLEEKLDVADSERKKSDLINRQLERDLREERRISEKMAKEIADLEKIMEDAKSAGIEADDMEDIALLISSLEREKEAFKQESIASRKDVDLLRLELDNQKSSQRIQISQLQDMLGRQLEEITSSQKKIEELEIRSSTLDEVRNQKAKLIRQQDRSKQDMRTLAKHIYHLRDELAKSKETQKKSMLAIEKNRELANELENVRKEIQKLNRLHSAIQNRDENKDTRIRTLRSELESGRARAQALEQEKRELINQLRVMQENRTSGE